jgi:hypothetical protein
MRFLSTMVSAAILTFGIASYARSETITFEGLCAPDGTLYPIADGYDGLSWTYIGAVGKYEAKGTGYERVAHGLVAGFSKAKRTAVFSSETPFSLVSGHFAAAWLPSIQVTFKAYRDGVFVGSKTVELDQTDTKVLFDEQFAHIDTVTFRASPKDIYNHVAFDNLKIVLDP